MPLPQPEDDESQSEFMQRCMSSEAAKEFEEQDQRVAVCLSQWRRGKQDMMASWYRIENKGESADIYLFDEVGAFGVSAKAFITELGKVDAPVLNLYLNSPGGDVFDGIAMYEGLKRHPAAVNVYIEGLAASSASFIAQAGDRITMAKSATMMIHEPFGGALGDSATMAKMAETLSAIGDTIAEIYADRAGGDAGEWRDRMKAETWYRAQEAVDAGLADEIRGAPAKAAALAGRVFNLSKFSHVPDWLEQPPIEDAGRVMSQANLDRLHTAMEGLATVHTGTCDMGASCPMHESMRGRLPAPEPPPDNNDAIIAAIARGMRQAKMEVFR